MADDGESRDLLVEKIKLLEDRNKELEQTAKDWQTSCSKLQEVNKTQTDTINSLSQQILTLTKEKEEGIIRLAKRKKIIKLLQQKVEKLRRRNTEGRLALEELERKRNGLTDKPSDWI